MQILTPEEFRSKKSSDTLVIYGCGRSINDLTERDLALFAQFDSFGFNWFCHSQIPTTFYMLREQANLPDRVSPGETLDDLFALLRTPAYEETCFVVHDVTGHTPEALPFAARENLDRLQAPAVVVKDLKGGTVTDFKKDIFESGVYHAKCSLNNVIHIAVYLNYKSIIFAGVDLYDSRYFWLAADEIRHTVSKKGQTEESKHAIAKVTLDLIRSTKRAYPIDMQTYNPRSLLSKVIPVYGDKRRKGVLRLFN